MRWFKLFFINEFIKNKRNERKISLDILSSGLCNKSALSQFEKGDIRLDKFMIDTLIQRLGVNEDFFEHFVTNNDMAIQDSRLEILNKINNNELDLAVKLIKEYEYYNNSKGSLQKQFSMYCYCLINEKENVDNNESLNRYKSIIELTVPNFENTDIKELVLSNFEIQLILNYAELLFIIDEQKGIKLYEKLLQYYDKDTIDKGIKAIKYPYIAFKYSKVLLNRQKYSSALALIERAINYLRETGKSNCMINLLNNKLIIARELELISEDVDKIQRWINDLEYIYQKYPNNSDSIIEDFTWINYNVIGDVILTRRNMMNLSQEKLSEGICDKKAISRIETKKTKKHPEFATLLLQKLNFSGELYGLEVVTLDYKTFALAQETTSNLIKNNFIIAKESLELLKNKLDLKNPINKQFIIHKESNVLHGLGEINIYTHLENLIKALEITISLESILNSKDIFLTRKEKVLLCNIIDCYEILNATDKLNESLSVLEKICNTDNLIESYIFSNHFNLQILSSKLANVGNYDYSNLILEHLLKNNLIIKNIGLLSSIIYDYAWNCKQENNKEYTKFFNLAYSLSEIVGNNYLMKLIKNEISINYFTHVSLD